MTVKYIVLEWGNDAGEFRIQNPESSSGRKADSMVQHGVSACGPEAGGGGKRWDGKWLDLGKGGQEVGKWTGFSHLATTFSHLGPDNSTQVVDFPHLSTVRLFFENH